MLTISLARRFRAEERSLQVLTMCFLGEELAVLCKLRFASSGEREGERRRKACQICPGKILRGVLPQYSQNTSRTTDIYQKVPILLSKGVFNLTKWITSDEEVKTQIPEADRSTKVVRTFEAEPRSSSILELNWCVETDSLSLSRN